MSEKKNLEKWRLVEEHAPARKNFPRRRVIIYGHDLWQADVVEMCPYIWFNKDYQYYRYRSYVIDVLSMHGP